MNTMTKGDVVSKGQTAWIKVKENRKHRNTQVHTHSHKNMKREIRSGERKC